MAHKIILVFILKIRSLDGLSNLSEVKVN